mgnify:CR=1 FL=1
MEGAARQLAAIAQITGYVFSIRDAMALSNFVCRFFCGNTGLYENHCGRVFPVPPAGDMPRRPTASQDFVHPMHKVPRENHFITKPLRPSTDGAAKLQRQVSSGSSHRCYVVQRIYRFLRAPQIVPRHITMMPSGIFFKVQEMGYPDRLILLLGRRYDE